MVAIALQSRASIATSGGPLASSFLPKCTHLLQAQLSPCPPNRLSFHGVAASTKQKKKARNTSSTARDWSYEHLMVLWDEVFEQCCTDSVKATKIRDLSYRGLSKHGRGCVLVFQEVQTRPRGSGTGFTSKPPKSSRRVPDFVTLDWYAVYLPREFLLDPRKAPNVETEPQDGETSGVDSTQVAGISKEGNVDASEGNVDTVGTVDRSCEDVTIDVEAIIRSAQDVYRFDSDDDDDEPDIDADDVDSNNVPLLILDDKEDSYTASTADSLLNRNEQDNNIATVASFSTDLNEEPLIIFDEDGHISNTASKAKMQSSKEISADNAGLNYKITQPETKFAPKDGAAEVVHSTLIEDFVDGASGKDGGDSSTHNASVFNEASNYVVELLEENMETEASCFNGPASNENTFVGSHGIHNQYDGQSEDSVELVTQQMLFATMRGVDRTRLMSLTANFDFEAKSFQFGRKMAMTDTKTMDAGGEDPYNPNEDELVLLLHLVTDGRPAFGADVVIACKDETSNFSQRKDSWKLKGKYKF